MLNASRRFRYTLDLKKEEQKKIILQKIRTHAQAIRVSELYQSFYLLERLLICTYDILLSFSLHQAAQLFQAYGQQANGAYFPFLCLIDTRGKLWYIQGVFLFADLNMFLNWHHACAMHAKMGSKIIHY